MAGTTPFVRQATGLVREFGLFDAVAINLFATGAITSAAILNTELGSLFPGVNIPEVLIIATLLGASNALVYGLLATVIPRSGGEYVYNGRILRPWVGFMSNWGLVVSQIVGVALGVTFTVTFAIPEAFETLGYQLSNNALTNAASTMVQEPTAFFLEALFVVLVMVIGLIGTRVLRRLISGAFVVAVLFSLIMPILFLTTSHSQFVTDFNQYISQVTGGNITNGYNTVLSKAASSGFVFGTSSFLSFLALPVGFYALVGFTASSYAGGEVRKTQSTQLKAIMIALFGAFLFILVTWGAYYNVVGQRFNDAALYLGSSSPIPVSPTVAFFAGLIAPDPIVNAIMQSGIIIYLVFDIFCFAMIVCTRSFFAWSFDRVFPTSFANVSSRGSPWLATITVGIFGIVALYISNYTNFFDVVVNFTILEAIVFGITGISAIALPYVRKDVFEAAPGIVRAKLGGIPVLVIAGIVNTILFGLLIYSSFELPAFSGPVGTGATIATVGVFVIGAVIYFVAKAIRKTQGIDLSLLHDEIPPE